MSERTLQARVLYRAKKHGWKVAHAGRAFVGDVESGEGQFVTPMSPGWPDLTCAKAGNRLIFMELKREQGEVEPEQWAWLAGLVVLTTAGGHGLMNQCAPHVRLFTLNVVIVREPAIAIAMGAALFGARVDSLQLAGGVVLAAAVVIGVRQETRPDPPLGTIE